MTIFEINGLDYTPADLIALSDSGKDQFPQWLRDVVKFLNLWYAKEDFITLHTSGSTGEPKMIKLSKQTMKASAKATNLFFNLKNDRVGLLCLSVNYIAGKMMIVRALESGMKLILCEPNATPLKNLNKKVDFCAMVPLQVEESFRNFGLAAFDNVDTIIVGGAPLSNKLKAVLIQSSCQFYTTYGMTETASHIALCKLSDDAQMIYKALPNIILRQDERGCLVIDAPLLCDTILQTNDVVEFLKDSSNEFIWKGRIDHVINSGGVKLFAETIEKNLESLIDRSFFITKYPNEKLGEMVVLAIEGDPLDSKAETFLMNRISEQVDRYERPRKIIYLHSFFRTPNGKIQRRLK